MRLCRVGTAALLLPVALTALHAQPVITRGVFGSERDPSPKR